MQTGILLIMLGLIGLVVVSNYQASKRPTFELVKADWYCSKQHTEFYGKTFRTVCDQWTRK